MTCPSIKQALDLFDEGLAAMRKEQQRFAFYYEKSFRSHCCLVACCAEMIASRIDSIDGQKAYILGLLHDYGKMVRDADNKEYFHDLTGYYEMKRLGFDDVARVCLTHTFPDKDFNTAIRKCAKPKSFWLRLTMMIMTVSFSFATFWSSVWDFPK